MSAGVCRLASLPGHTCVGEAHLFPAGWLCEAAAPPRPPAPPAGTTAADLLADKRARDTARAAERAAAAVEYAHARGLR